MPDSCTPLQQCKDLDGRMLLQRTIYGPQFGFMPQANLMGMSAAGAGIRPYVDLTLGMTWSQVGLCQAPPVSVMGLAPGEVVTVGIRTRNSRSFSDLVSDAAEASQTSSHSDRHVSERGTQPVPQAPSSGGGGGGGSDFLGSVASLAPLAIALFASILEDGLSVVEDIAGGGGGGDLTSQAGNAISGLIDNGILGIGGGGGGGGKGSSAVVETWSMTDEILNTVTRSESQSHLRQSTVTTSEETEQTIKRTFGNPYLDRSLQLRFIPVFNQFAVRVELLRVTPGLVTHFTEPVPGLPVQVGASVGNNRVSLLSRTAVAEAAPSLRPIASALYVANQAGNDDAVRRPVREVMRALGSRSNSTAQVEHGLSWSRTEVRGNGVHVPLSAPENVVSGWKLKDALAKKFNSAIGRLSPERLGEIFAVQTRTVSIFAGTHVEAVPGSCVLPDIPAELKIVVPGSTQYSIREKEGGK